MLHSAIVTIFLCGAKPITLVPTRSIDGTSGGTAITTSEEFGETDSVVNNRPSKEARAGV